MDGAVHLGSILLVFWLPVCFSSHFRGAIITWKPGDISRREIIVDFRISWRMTYEYYFHCDANTIASGKLIGNGDQLTCFTNCYGNFGSVNYKCTDFSTAEDWSSGRGTVTFQYPAGNTYYDFGYAGSAWISLNWGGSGSWTLRVSADVSPRVDGLINSSPVVEIPPVVRLQYGCNHTIVLPVSDPDGDTVRCRWASQAKRECGSICQVFPHSTLDQDTCEITYEAVYEYGWYGLAIQVEDFYSLNSTSPMSSIPVQFLVYVFKSTEDTCNKTIEFVSPTPHSSACIGVPKDTIYNATIAMQVANSNRSVVEIKTISPVGLTKGAISKVSDRVWQMGVTWTPQAASTTQNIFCFTAVDSTQSESEKRCISLLAGVDPPELEQSSNVSSLEYPTRDRWSVKFNQKIVQTHTSAFIRIFLAFNDTELEVIDASDTAMISLNETQQWLQFRTAVNFIEKQQYYILFDSGVVRSTTYCGVESTAVTDMHFWRFTIRDVTPPKMVQRNVPALSDGSVVNVTWLYDEPVFVQCQLVEPGGQQSSVPCNDSWTGIQLHDGNYALKVQATDEAGNQGMEEILYWRVDTVPPVVTITTHPAQVSNAKTVTFWWMSSESCSYKCRLVPSNWMNCSVHRYVQLTIPDEASGSEVSFEVQGTDLAGNVGDIAAYNWTADFDPPTIRLCGHGTRLNVSCQQGVKPEQVCAAQATDKVDLKPSLTHHDAGSNCDIIRTWTAKDAAGNIASVSQNIHVTVDTPIRILKAPAQISVACGTLHEKELENVLIGRFDIEHPCGMPLTYSYKDVPNTDGCDVVVTREWRISDGCGTPTEIQQQIRVMHVRHPLSPENGQVGTALSLYLRWPASGTHTKYEVSVWEKSGTRPSQPDAITWNSYHLLSALKSDTQYLWQVVFSFSENETFVGPVWGFQTRKYADLTVKSVTLPPTGFSGQTYEIQWTVMNVGKLLAQSYWRDAVYLSFTNTFSEATLLTTVTQYNIIMPNDGYSSKASIKFGDDQTGTAYFFIKTNVYNNVEEVNTTNNVGMRSMEVKLTPPPDLVVSSVVTRESSYSGQTISLRWTVVNSGSGPTLTGTWTDRIWWSKDKTKDFSDQHLGSATRYGNLAPGGNYTVVRYVVVPEFITGDFFILVETDSWNQVFEFNNEGNNVASVQHPIHIILTPPPDLVVTSIAAPATLRTGENLTVTWWVSNQGDLVPSSQAYWQDRVDLISTSTSSWTKTLQYRGYYGVLGPSSTYNATQSFPITTDIPTDVYIIRITTNYDHRLFEFNATDNNVLDSHKIQIVKSLPNLHIDQFTLTVDSSLDSAVLQATWTVINIGQIGTLTKDWIDTLRLTSPSQYGNTILLQTERGNGSRLEPGKSYTISKNFSLPREVYENVGITVTVDDMYQSTGDDDRSDNAATRLVYVPLLAPDLHIVNNVSVGDDIMAGQQLLVTYTVENKGNRNVTDMTWMDAVWIEGGNGRSDCGACRISNQHYLNGNLSLSHSYTVTSKFSISESWSGEFVLSIRADFQSDIFEGPNTHNNIFTKNIHIEAAPKPDLSVHHVQSKLSGKLGEDKILSIEWTVRNTGNSMKTLKSWTDSVGFIENGNLTQFLALESFQNYHKLEASSEYSVNKTVIVPAYINGIIQFCIYVDSANQLKEAFSKEDNFLCEATNVTIKKPLEASLRATVTGVRAVKDGVIAPGASLYASYTVENTGDLATADSSWIDSVYIINTAASSVEQLLAEGTSVAEVTHIGLLQPRNKYNVTQVVTIPDTFSGNVMMYVLPNHTYGSYLYAGIPGNYGHYTGGSAGNTPLSAATSNFTSTIMVPGLLPNLFIQTNISLTDCTGGQPVTVEYRLTNNGSAPVGRYWYDAVYLSEDYILDVFDTKLKTVLRQDTVGVNKTVVYNITFTLPLDMDTKSYFLIFKCDSRDDIFEDNEIDNEARSVIQLQQRTSTDIFVTDVIAPSTASYSQSIKIAWTVKNNGTQAARGYKCDSAYLSDDDIWDITDAVVGKPQCTAFSLSSNTSAVHSTVTAPTPAVAAGSYNTLVKSRSNVLDVNQENNVAVAKNRTQVTVATLMLGTTVNDTLGSNGLKLYHVTDVPLDKTLVINITSDCTNCFSVFQKGGSPAQLYDFEQTATNLNQRFTLLTVPNTIKTDYYTLIQNTDNIKHEILTSVKLAKFEILEVFPRYVMKEFDVTLRIEGTLFPDDVTAYLVNDNSKESVEAIKLYYFSSTEIYATFNLPKTTLLTNGTLKLVSASKNNSTLYSETIQVKAGATGYLTTTLSPLGNLRANEHGLISLTVENSGDSDMLVPLVLVQAKGEGEIKLNDRNKLHPYKQEYFLIASSESGPAGILPPKSYARFYFNALQNVELLGHGFLSATMDVTVSILTPDRKVPNPFLTQKEALKPSHYDPEGWEPVWNNFLSMTGNSSHTLITKMSAVVSELSLVSHRNWMVDDMIQHLLHIADSPMGDKLDVAVSDVAMETDLTVGLVVSRHLSTRIGYRSQSGPMGKGWILPLWNTRIKEVEEDLMLVTFDKKDIVFVKWEEGVFSNLEAGEVHLADNDYILTRPSDKQRYHFDALSLRLKSVVSLVDESRLDLVYKDDRLTEIRHSRGSWVDVFYDSLGRIVQMEVKNTSVPLSRADSHALYEYQVEGNQLRAAVVGGKRTSYSYNYDSSIRSVTYSDNTMELWEYSSMGHMTAKRYIAHNAQVSGAEYHYQDSGTVTMTTLPGNFVANVTFDENGEIVMIRRDKFLPVKTLNTRNMKIDMEGNFVLTKRLFTNDKQKRVKIEDGNGDSIELRYNDNGQLLSFLDGGQNVYRLSYDNTTGSLNHVAFPDGTDITYTYSNLKQQIKNQNGDIKTLEYNDQKQLITKTASTNHITSYEYYRGGQLKQATSKDSMIRFDYEGDKPTEVAFSDSSIHYEYTDSGDLRRLSTTRDYAADYVYDDNRRVKEVRDGTTNTPLVKVSYSQTGKIKTKVFGNNASAVYEYDKDTDLLKQLINYYPNGTEATFFKYSYSRRQRRVALETKEGLWEFEYDTAGQVIKMTSNGGSVTRFVYDSRKNRKAVFVDGVEKYFSVNSMNQYEAYGSTKFAYDKNGNMIQKNSSDATSRFIFDEDNTLLEMKSDSHNCSFEYDPLGNLRSKVCGGVRTRYLTDPFGYLGNTVLEQTSDSGDRLHMYYGGPQIGLIALKNNNGMNYFQYDPLGSVVGILNQNGDLLNWYQSDPFGQILQSHESFESPFTFIGQWGVLRVKESQNIFLMRARLYDSELGRFLSIDPDGLSARSKNFYAYCGNNPVHCKDPEGRFWWVVAKVVGKGVWSGAKYWYTHHNDADFSWGGVAGATVEGTLNGVIDLIPVPGWARTVIKGGSKVAGNYIQHLIDGKDYSWKQAARDYGEFELNEWEGKGLDRLFGNILPDKLREKLKEKGLDILNNQIDELISKIKKAGEECGHLEFWTRKSMPICHPLDALKDALNSAAKAIYKWVISRDPNDMIGPKGYGAARFIKGDHQLTYIIRFENDENATAPAQRVYVEHQYSKDLDPRSFVMGDFGFGDFVQEVRDGSKFFQGSINLTAEMGIFVSVVAGMDPVRKIITWEFQALDPTTGEAPTSVDVGFLPPNNGTSGQGYVSFSMRSLPSSPHLTVINANASIYFDENEPIDTPNVFNTLDKMPPVVNGSVVQEVLSSGTAAMKFSSLDLGSGIDYINLFLKQDESIILLKAEIRDTIVSLPELQPGANYSLYPTAVDNVGNRQDIDVTEVTSGSWIWIVLPQIGGGICNCSNHGNCSEGTPVCLCEDGYYGDHCDTVVAPHEPPILDLRAEVGTQGESVLLYLSAKNQSGPVDHMTITVTGFPSWTVFSVGNLTDQNSLVLDYSEFGPLNMTVPDNFYGNVTLHVEVNETSGDVSITRTGELLVMIYSDTGKTELNIDGCFFTSDHKTATVRLNASASFLMGNVTIPYTMAVTLPPWASLMGGEHSGNTYLLQNNETEYTIVTGNNFQPFNVTMSVSFALAGSRILHKQYEINKTCTACPTNTYGIDCEGNCMCNQINQFDCNKFDGTCICLPGYTGATCDQDVDECSLGVGLCDIALHRQCYNTLGGYTCGCDSGFWDDRGNCTECVGLRTGYNCSQLCPCNPNNTASCHPELRTCQCKPGWAGLQCNQDVDECSGATSGGGELCKGDNNTVCQNNPGGYYCLCRRGFQSENNTCTEIPKTVNPTVVSPSDGEVKATRIEAKFNVYIPATDNLEAAYTYKKYEQEASHMLNNYYRSMLGVGFVRVIIVDLRRGSLIVDHQVVTRSHAFVLQELGYAVHELAQQPDLTFFGKPVKAEDVTVGNVPVKGGQNGTGKTNDPCISFTAISPCGSGESCAIVNKLPTCRPDQVVITKTDKKDKSSVHRTILLAIFIPVSVLLIIFVMCVARSYWQNRTKKAGVSKLDNIELQPDSNRKERHTAGAHSNPIYKSDDYEESGPPDSTMIQGPARHDHAGPSSKSGYVGTVSQPEEPPADYLVSSRSDSRHSGDYGNHHHSVTGSRVWRKMNQDAGPNKLSLCRPGSMEDMQGKRYSSGGRGREIQTQNGY